MAVCHLHAEEQALRAGGQREIVGNAPGLGGRRAGPPSLQPVGRAAVADLRSEAAHRPVFTSQAAAGKIQPVRGAQPCIDAACSGKITGKIILQAAEKNIVFIEKRGRHGRAHQTGRAEIAVGRTVETVGPDGRHLQPGNAVERRLLPDVERNRRIDTLAYQVVRTGRHGNHAAAQVFPDPQRSRRVVDVDVGRPRLQIGVDDRMLPGIGIKFPDGQGFIAEIMDPHRIRAARQDIGQLVPAAGIGRRVILRVRRLVDDHHGHALDRPVIVDNPAPDRRRRHLRRRGQSYK